MKFRKKPAVVEAMQFSDETKDRCFHFVSGNRHAVHDVVDGSPILVIETLEGDMRASIGD